MNETEKAEERARSYSFAGHEPSHTYQVRSDAPTSLEPFGCQPWGIASRLLSSGNTEISFTAYEAPGQCICEIERGPDTLIVKSRWVYRAWSGIIKCLGGFPDGVRNRAWTALTSDKRELWVGRGERKFYILTGREDKEWNLIREVELPPLAAGVSPRFLASAAFVGQSLFTVEHDADYRCECIEYCPSESGWDRKLYSVLMPFRYGIALAEVEGYEEMRTVTVTAPSSKEEPGIYLGNTLITPDVYGTGIAPLADGGALVTCNWLEGGGQFRGKPGTLTYIPPAMFPKGMKWVR